MKSRISELTQVERWALGQEGRIKSRRVDWKPSPEMMRLREIEKLIRHRHDGMVPDPEDTDDRGTCLAYVTAAAFSCAGQAVEGWCRRWAPWISESELVEIKARAGKRRRMITADGAAAMLSLTWAERMELGIKTIGACDISKADRKKLAKERKRTRDRVRQEHRRRAAGRSDRKSHAPQSLEQIKPWVADGISRATWYRRRETAVSRIDIYTNGDTRVSTAEGDITAAASANCGTDLPAVSQPIAGGKADRCGSPETQFLAEVQEAAPHGRRDKNSIGEAA